ncbi:M23 family metallopeptidase [Prauserella halophila]|uniref:M23 family metallopeptidase n=1 Tax=Prauserella halophila TaxID=185641 RepID=A0ABP4GYK1_9PSEU|nr:M23 family metallopeptidase [Prauserella halophila]MCP2237009.1 Membrane proteins related to metalloendopeptidases [Prauserella halophila]
MKFRKISAAIGAVAVAATATLVSVGAGQASAAPAFKMPFKCGYTATAATWRDHSPENSVDFQKSGIWKTPVLASASGTVKRVANEGSTSYGKWIEIDHGGGWTTRYAHLYSQGVSVGQKVNAGTRIGRVGNTGGSTGPHLHFEQRRYGSAKRVVLGGRNVPYFTKTDFTSKNCGGGGSNPYTPKEICGNGFKVINQRGLDGNGRVYLMYNTNTGKNCVTTIKNTNIGKASWTVSFLEVQGQNRKRDRGQFSYYAGPVKAQAANQCVKWGGAVGGKSFASNFGHCGS